MFGGVAVGTVADKLGRKTALLYNNALAIVAAALMTGAKYVGNYWLVTIGRFIIGLNSGKGNSSKKKTIHSNLFSIHYLLQD